MSERQLSAKVVELTADQAREFGKPVLDHLRALRAAGIDEHMALGGVMYALGLALAEARVVIGRSALVRDALAPLQAGYDSGMQQHEAGRAQKAGT